MPPWACITACLTATGRRGAARIIAKHPDPALQGAGNGRPPSSFTEGSAVFGGQANLLQAIVNMFALYNPDIIAIHTTCLSETIGDDIVQIVAKAREEGKVRPESTSSTPTRPVTSGRT